MKIPRNEALSLLNVFVLSMFFSCGVALKQPGQLRKASLCLSRVAAMPKAEGYGALCTSIAALYQQQQKSASSFSALQQESERTSASHRALEQQNAALMKQNHDLMKKLEDQLVHRIAQEKESQTDIAKTLKTGVAQRDSAWRGIVRRLLDDKKALKKQVSLLQQQASNASNSAVAEHNRAILLAQNRANKTQDTESKKVRGMMLQIQALQRENAQLVQKCA